MNLCSQFKLVTLLCAGSPRMCTDFELSLSANETVHLPTPRIKETSIMHNLTASCCPPISVLPTAIIMNIRTGSTPPSVCSCVCLSAIKRPKSSTVLMYKPKPSCSSSDGARSTWARVAHSSPAQFAHVVTSHKTCPGSLYHSVQSSDKPAASNRVCHHRSFSSWSINRDRHRRYREGDRVQVMRGPPTSQHKINLPDFRLLSLEVNPAIHICSNSFSRVQAICGSMRVILKSTCHTHPLDWSTLTVMDLVVSSSRNYFLKVCKSGSTNLGCFPSGCDCLVYEM